MSAEHRITVEGPLRYPGGKDGLYHARCSEGDYVSAAGTAARVAQYGKQHTDAKNSASCPSTDPDTGLRCTNTEFGHTTHSCTIEWSDND